jgi:alpha-galactosidase
VSETIWLTGSRTGLLVDLGTGTLPVVRWWGVGGPDATDPDVAAHVTTPAQALMSVDERVQLSLIPQHAGGFQGASGLLGRFGDGTGWAPRFVTTAVETASDRLVVRGDDPRAGLRVHVELRIDEHDVLATRAAVTNVRGEAADGLTGALELPAESDGLGRDPVPRGVDPALVYHLDVLRLTLPVPDRAREVATFTGRWIREMHLQRAPWLVGRVERVNVRGRSSHQDPPLLFVGEDGFSEERGLVWAMHLAWPGNHEVRADRTADGFAYLQAAEHLHPGEIALLPGQTYLSPWQYATASDRGLNGVSDAFHGHIRARASHPARPRPVTMNTWEAVYFDHDQRRLQDLVAAAADVGVERFVLDDGWFTRRRDDRAGLGDWRVDTDKHPDGLGSLAQRVRAAGMEFGLWVEPEMVNPESDLFRSDPSVALAPEDAPLSRHQLVLDLTREEVWRHLHDRLTALIDDTGAAYLKWDLNRDQVAAEHDGRAGSHAQALAALRLLETLVTEHPGLEIESCASGGGRMDLGILAWTHRVWTSDCNDPVERQRIQRGASYLLPPELLGSHVGPGMAHTTARTTLLPFRLATAFFGHLGFEWDLTATTAEERARIRDAVALYREWREVLHGGRVVRVDHPDDGALVHATVTPDRALLCHAQLATSAWSRPAAVRCPGLVPDRRYVVRSVPALTDFTGGQTLPPAWYDNGEVVLTGRALDTHGIALHVHQPQTATVLSIVAAD